MTSDDLFKIKDKIVEATVLPKEVLIRLDNGGLFVVENDTYNQFYINAIKKSNLFNG